METVKSLKDFEEKMLSEARNAFAKLRPEMQSAFLREHSWAETHLGGVLLFGIVAGFTAALAMVRVGIL